MPVTVCPARDDVPTGRARSTRPADRPIGLARARELAPALGRCRQLPRGSHLFLAGEPFAGLHLIASGSLKVYATSLGGEEQVLGFFLRDDVLGLEAVSDRRHAYSAIALERTEVIELSLEGLQAGPDPDPRSGEHGLLQRLCCEAIASDYAARRSRSTQFAEQRLSLFLVGLWNRLDAGDRARGELSLPMSRRDIGNHLGMALETVSRSFSRLERRDVLRVRRRSVRVIDIDSLHRAAGDVPVTPRLQVAPRPELSFEHHTENAR